MKLIQSLIIIFSCNIILGQQLGTSSLFHENFGIINSSLLAKDASTSLLLNYRKQWVSVPNSPEYLTGLFSLPLKNNKIGLGFEINSNNIGMVQRQQLLGGYRYSVEINQKSKINLGFGAGIERNQIDLSRVAAQDLQEMSNYQITQRAIIGTFNIGLSFIYQNLVVGVSSNLYTGNRLNLTNPVSTNTIAFSKIPNYNMQLSYLFNIKNRWAYQPSLMLFSTQGLPVYADFSNKFTFDKKVSFGLGYRQLNDVNLFLSYTFVNQLKVSYLYQHNLGKFSGALSGTHEIGLIFSLNSNSNTTSTFSTSNRSAKFLQEQIDSEQQKISELNRQLDSLNKKLSNQENELQDLKRNQIGEKELNELIDSLNLTPRDEPVVTLITRYQAINVQSQNDIDALVEEDNSDYQIVLGAFRNVDKARELHKTLIRELSLDLEIVEIKSANKTMFFVCLKPHYLTVKKAAQEVLQFKKTYKSRYVNYLNGDPWILKMNKSQIDK